MSDNFDVLFSTKIDQNTFKTQTLHVEKNKTHGRSIELVSVKAKGVLKKFANGFKKIFGIEQRRVAKLCTKSKDLKSQIEQKTPEDLQRLKTNLLEVENWVNQYNKKLGPLKIFLKIKCPLQGVQAEIKSKIANEIAELNLTEDQKQANAIAKAFLRGECANLRQLGVPQTIKQIQEYDYRTKESEHDFVQWIFPSFKPSKPNPLSPVLIPKLLEELKNDPVIVANIRKSFLAMLDFYGLKYNEQTHVVLKANFEERSKVWLKAENHNFLRITRILECLDNFGLAKEKEAFQKFMLQLAAEHNQIISPTTASYWKDPHQ